MTFAAVGTFVQSVTTTLALNPTKIGNFYLVEVLAESSTVYCSSVTGGNCSWSVAGTKFAGTNNAGYATIFIGKAIATGSANATLAFSGTTPAFEAVGQQFSSTAGQWAQDGPQGTLDLVTGTSTWPSLAPSGSGDLYFGFFSDSGTASAGSTSGYTYDVNSQGDGLAFNPGCTSAAQAPAWGDSGQVFGAAILLRETSYGPSSHAVQVRQPQKGFHAGLVYSSAPASLGSFYGATYNLYYGTGAYSSAYSTGRISANYGTLPQPSITNAGPVFYPADSPARARIPQDAPRGRILGISGGAPVQNPSLGPAFRPARTPARFRPVLPPRGRIRSSPGAPVHNPAAGPKLPPVRHAVRARYLNPVYVLGDPGLIYVNSWDGRTP